MLVSFVYKSSHLLIFNKAILWYLEITVLAPSNAAVDTFLKSGDATIGNYSENLQALLQYHVIKGHYPRASLKQTPLFLQTLASNGTSYANVTGGQRIVVTSSGQNITFQSGFKRKSTLKTGVCITVSCLYRNGKASKALQLINPGFLLFQRIRWRRCPCNWSSS